LARERQAGYRALVHDLVIHPSPYFTVSQATSLGILGYVIVECRSERTRLDALDAEALRDLAHCLAETERVLRELLKPERVYTLRFGEYLERIHFHVIPRTAQLASAYAAATSDAPPYNGARLVAWLWDHEPELRASEDELAAFVERARSSFRPRPA
jgi:diadenosine tetraphosphate (Ap4A) HIT family hydrolase